jgi:3-phenylpropionate/trans-cinnamate dioxygenase ferredoxin reductase subunit
VLRGDPANKSFACLYIKDSILVAVDAINSPRDFMQSKELIANRVVIDPEQLADADVVLRDLG